MVQVLSYEQEVLDRLTAPVQVGTPAEADVEFTRTCFGPAVPAPPTVRLERHREADVALSKRRRVFEPSVKLSSPLGLCLRRNDLLTSEPETSCSCDACDATLLMRTSLRVLPFTVARATAFTPMALKVGW